MATSRVTLSWIFWIGVLIAVGLAFLPTDLDFGAIALGVATGIYIGFHDESFARVRSTLWLLLFGATVLSVVAFHAPPDSARAVLEFSRSAVLPYSRVVTSSGLALGYGFLLAALLVLVRALIAPGAPALPVGSRSTFGRVSIVVGGLAVLFAVIARYAASIYVADDWFITEFIEGHNLWRPGDGNLEARATTFFTLTELNAITWCYSASIVLALAAVLGSFAAELKNEESLMHAAGHVLGGMAIIAIDWRWGLPALIATGMALLVTRHVRREP